LFGLYVVVVVVVVFAWSMGRKLNLEGNELLDDGVIELSKGFPQSTMLETLSLSCTGFGAGACPALAKNIPELKCLRFIDLEGNLIGEDGGVALRDMLQTATHVQHLKVTPSLSPALFTEIMNLVIGHRPSTKKKKKGKKGKGKKKKAKK
jgi:hypothetical protein